MSAYRIIVSVVVVLCAAEMVVAGVITPVSQNRGVMIWAEASTPGGGYDTSSDSMSITNSGPFGPFIELVQASAQVFGPPEAGAEGEATQNSSIEPNGISATGGAHCEAFGEMYEVDPGPPPVIEESEAYCDGSSDFGVVFTVGQTSTWTLTGTMSIWGFSDHVAITFYEDTTELLYAELDHTGGPDTIDETFVLTPGKDYSLTAMAYACAMAYGDSYETGGADFDMTFVPEPATLSLLAVGGIGLLLKRKSQIRCGRRK